MDKRAFLRTAGLLGAASLLPSPRLIAAGATGKKAGGCVLIPTETAGPFPLDLTDNAFYFRQDIREGIPGVELRQRLRIIGLENCAPMPNIRVHIWHCSNVGLYSGYSLPINPGQEGFTYLRGHQFTDANGEVEFITILPGWYPGRVCHIHFRVQVSSNYAATSQLSYPEDAKQDIYAAHPDLYPNGVDPVGLAQDGAFVDGYENQLASLGMNSEGQLESFLEVAVQGTGIPIGVLERATAERFELGQNLPNPYQGKTVVPILVKEPGDLMLDLFALQGKKVATVERQGVRPGEHRIELDMAALGLPTANYVYQARLRSASGEWMAHRMMTALR
jgi:hypothetical protein